MRHLLLPALLALLFVCGLAAQQQAPHVVETKPLDPADEVKQFSLPPGFEAQLVASDPDIKKPMNLAFDDQGRLWVTDTIEYPHPAKDGKKARDTIKVLEDFGPDGKARKITTFADGLNIPIGLLPLTGKSPRQALVFSIPSVQRLTDSKGNGAADRREVFLSGYGHRDTHGMTSGFTPGFDGWVYACHGYANTSAVKGKEGKQVHMNSGNTYRFKPDGRLEQYTWGQVNPFGLSIDPWGNLYSADCHSQPIYQLIRGAYYPSFGKPHDGLGFAPTTITNYRGSTAISGIAYYAADAFPAKYQGSAFVGDVMTNQIVQFELAWDGTSPRATQKVFLDSKDRWFRPVDVKLGPDGALYIADFYNCIIGHYEVDLNHPKRDRERGRVWRIVYTGKDHKGAPARTDFTKASVKDLAGDLGHPNLTVRLMATQQLVHRGKDVVSSVTPLLKDGTTEQRAHALWVLERLGALDEKAWRQVAKDKEPLVRAHAMRVLSERAKASEGERDLAVTMLLDKEPRVQRAAADALGRHPRTENVKPLLVLRHQAPRSDTHLIHTAKIALREQMRLADSWKDSDQWTEKEARVIASVALGVPSKESAAFLVKHLSEYSYPSARRSDFVRHAARYADEPRAKELVAWAKKAGEGKPGEAAELLRAIYRGAQEKGASVSDEVKVWANDLASTLLGSSAEAELRLGVEIASGLRLGKQEAKVVGLVTDAKRPEGVRIAAMGALLGLDAKKHAATLGKVLVDSAAPLGVREQAALILGRANQLHTRKELLTALQLVPSRVQSKVVLALAQTREGVADLVVAAESGKVSARMLTDREVSLRVALSRLPDIKEKLKKLTAGLPAADAKLAKLIAERQKGYSGAKADAGRGLKVFEKHCANCHQVAGKGAKVGPQLDGIGLRGLERLLEDVLDPNRNVDQAFRQTTITTTKGQVVSGLQLREVGEVVVLADQQGKELRFAKKDIEKREVTPLSPMPANVGELMKEEEFNDLMRYLLTLRPAVNEKK